MTEDKVKKFVFKNWHWLTFTVFSFLSLSFLIFQRGIWSFTDSGFFYSDLLQAKKIAISKLGQFATTDGFYLGFDNSASSFGHLIISVYQVILTFLLGSDLGQILYYLIYYLTIFYFGRKLLKKLFPKLADLEINIGALFLTFNPFALLISTLFSIEYIYALFIAFAYCFLSYLEKGKIKYLLPSIFFGIYLLSYHRLIPIIIITLIFIFWIFYDQKYFDLKRWVIFGTIFVICASPFIVGNLSDLNDSSNIITNYQDAFRKFEKANYNFKSSFANSLSYPGGFTPSALSFYYNNRGLPGFADNFAVKDSFEFFKIIQIIFNLLVLLLAITIIKDKKKTKIIGLTILVILINTIGFFVNFNTFSFLNQTGLVFLYNDYGFIQFIQIFLFTFLIVILLADIKENKRLQKKFSLVIFLIMAYIFINLLPFMSGHYGFKKVKEIPENYQQEIYTGKKYDTAEAALFAPYHWLNFDWSPYYLNLNSYQSSKYSSLIVPNLRLIDDEFVTFYNQIYDNLDREEFHNTAIFNLKNIFIFHDVEDANYNIDTYQVTNIEQRSIELFSQLQKRDDLEIVSNNENFTQYRFNDANDYDFFVYSPKSIIELSIDNFYSKKLNLVDKPVLLDKSRFNKINIVDEINFELNSPFVFLKTSPDNANKYYLKLTVMKDHPFLIHFNQTFDDSWTIYFSDQAEWDSVSCNNDWQNFVITQNSRCSVNGTAFDLTDIKFLTRKHLKPENHFPGNIIGNTFIVMPDDIPKKYKNGDELYLIIYFQKQIYYSIALALSGLMFIVLIISAGISLIRNKLFPKKYDQ